MSKKYTGVIPPIVTPVDAGENVDEKGLRKLIGHCVDNGIHGIFVAGSNGECMALTQGERDRAIAIAIDEAGGRVPVMAGVMDSSTRRVIENIKRLEQMGEAAAVVTPVFYSRHATQDETVRHFEEISRQTNVDLFIYNIPPFTGQTLKAETIFRIAQIDKVIGYKDTSGSFPDFQKCLAHFKGTDFVLHQGASNLSAASLLLGADGYIPSMAPLFPEPHVMMYEYGRKGDIANTMACNDILSEISEIWPLSKSQTSSTKYALSRLGFFDKRVILPTEPTRPDEEKRIDEKIAAIRERIARFLEARR
ncbi:MAG: dihydrodipicolinate synthase family protein [Candidatus Accumulibacter sp.]|jgi:4-hydroxy-tetrahydrodipicolinate synthase|nr:dihydrodipicolinate synthase family protein [Accumulibacter sp.]